MVRGTKDEPGKNQEYDILHDCAYHPHGLLRETGRGLTVILPVAIPSLTTEQTTFRDLCVQGLSGFRAQGVSFFRKT